MNNDKVKLFFISQSLGLTYFWIAIAIPYLIYRGLSSSQAFSLLALYQLMGVILEYPTGLIGDRFGHRKVIYIANTLNFLSVLIMALDGNYYIYLFALILMAMGNGFSSGNDMGILKNISTNIKKDSANYNALMDFVIFISAIVGGLISKISYELALIVSGFFMLSANIPLFLMKDGVDQNKNTNSIIYIVKSGFLSLRDSTLRQLFIIVALFGGYSYAIKSIFGSFGSLYGIDISTIGLLVGLSGLARSVGGKIYAELQNQNSTTVVVIIVLLLFVMGIFPIYPVVIGSILLIQFLLGYLLSKIDGDIHNLANNDARASIFSLKRVIMRLVTANYLIIYGYTVGVGQISLLMYGTSAMLFAGVIFAWNYLNFKNAIKDQV